MLFNIRVSYRIGRRHRRRGLFRVNYSVLFDSRIYIDATIRSLDFSYKIYHVQPHTENELNTIRTLVGNDNADMEVDILFHSRDLDTPTEVMVRPDMQDHFELFLSAHDIDYEVAINDLKQ